MASAPLSASDSAQCKRETESLKGPLQSLQVTAQAVQATITECVVFSCFFFKAKTLRSWSSKGTKFFGVLRQMLTAKNYSAQFMMLANEIEDARSSLQLCVATMNFLKLDDIQAELRSRMSAAEVQAVMAAAKATDAQQFGDKVKQVMAIDDEFKRELQSNFDAIKDHMGSEFGSLRSYLEGEFHRVHEKLDSMSQKLDTMRQLNPTVREIDWEELELDTTKPVGAGAYGTVLKGRWGTRDVAVKMLSLQGTGARMLKELRLEALQLASISSKHVIELKGLVFEDPHYALVMEFASPDLFKFLTDVDELPWGQRWCIAKEIALGLQAVHKAGIMHHDLRAANVLIGQPPRLCRLTDFGLSKTKQQSSRNSKSVSGNPIWLAPEYQNASPYSMACDIFSYAVTLFEVASLGELPFAGRNPDVVRQLYLEAKRDTLPNDVPAEFKQLVERCWSQVKPHSLLTVLNSSEVTFHRMQNRVQPFQRCSNISRQHSWQIAKLTC